MTWDYIGAICSTALWPSNMKADHTRSFNFLALPRFGKHKKNLKTLLLIFLLNLKFTDLPHTTRLV